MRETRAAWAWTCAARAIFGMSDNEFLNKKVHFFFFFMVSCKMWI